MENKPLPEANFEKGVPAIFVVLGLLVILGGLTFAVYLLGNEVSKSSSTESLGVSFKQIEEQVIKKVQQFAQPTTAPVTAQQQAQPAQPEEIEQANPATSQNALSTYDIGAYLTYGNQALSLDRAVAKVTPDRMRLIVGLFEKTQGSKEKPALAMIFEFKTARAKCSVENVKELALLFNLRSMGGIAAQQVQVVKRSSDEIALALTSFACDLKPGGRLEMHSLGSDPTLIKPRGSTFAWGLRLTQEIG